jgi:hypothetical protein
MVRSNLTGIFTWPHTFAVNVGVAVKDVSCVNNASAVNAASSALLTHSWSWALLEKPPIMQLLKNFPVFYGTWRFITVLKRTLHWSISWVTSIQSIPSYPIPLSSLLILSTHLHHGLSSGLFPSGFPTNILYAFASRPTLAKSIARMHVLQVYLAQSECDGDRTEPISERPWFLYACKVWIRTMPKSVPYAGYHSRDIAWRVFRKRIELIKAVV